MNPEACLKKLKELSVHLGPDKERPQFLNILDMLETYYFETLIHRNEPKLYIFYDLYSEFVFRGGIAVAIADNKDRAITILKRNALLHENFKNFCNLLDKILSRFRIADQECELLKSVYPSLIIQQVALYPNDWSDEHFQTLKNAKYLELPINHEYGLIYGELYR